ncbi:MAG: hypothetical protein IJF06_01470, partial [Bacteroidaceae bacterium]|nr:hypothetical protein [Bacteroidaceae bacterium]
VAPDVTANEKIGPETKADDIKSDESDWKNMGKSAARLRLKELNDYPYNNQGLRCTMQSFFVTLFCKKIDTKWHYTEFYFYIRKIMRTHARLHFEQ